MGFAVTIAAIPRDRRDAFLQAAGVQVTDRPDPDGAGLEAATTLGAHFLIWRNMRVAKTFAEVDWPNLSQAAPITVLDIVDTAGAQVLRGFEAGEQRWEISFHDQNDDLLAVKGTPPVDVAAKRQQLRAEHLERHPEDRTEDDEDLVAGYGMAIPSRLFEDQTGLYYEDGPPEGLYAMAPPLPEVRLTWTGERKEPSKPWWKIW